ncbi:hypothetical protein RE9414_17160 [Prescottella equi]|nr:hypothetical protein RE9414_17160 [Prescottella equi]
MRTDERSSSNVTSRTPCRRFSIAQTQTQAIDTFLRLGARLQREFNPVIRNVYSEGLQKFRFDYSMHGTVLATKQDGASWRIEVQRK